MVARLQEKSTGISLGWSVRIEIVNIALAPERYPCNAFEIQQE
jgi:hypothetical protein